MVCKGCGGCVNGVRRECEGCMEGVWCVEGGLKKMNLIKLSYITVYLYLTLPKIQNDRNIQMLYCT